MCNKEQVYKLNQPIAGKILTGLSFADGVHYHWGDKEIAVIPSLTGEIEWMVRPLALPKDVVAAVRTFRSRAANSWLIEVKRSSLSATQGYVHVFINGEEIMCFEDVRELVNGVYQHKIADEDLGKYVVSSFWHPLEDIYHYSERAKALFYSKWRNKE